MTHTITIDQVLPYIGEFGRFQKLLNALLFICCLPASYQIMFMYFTTVTPSWTCAQNSTICTLNGTLSAEDYSRCDMPPTEWQYTEHKGYSLATQFNICHDQWKLNLASSIMFMGWGIGAFVCGWIGDQYGRKRVFLPSVAVIITVGFTSTFVTSIYQMIGCRFVIGFFLPGVHLQAFILVSELVGSKHRPLTGLLVYLANPIGWTIITLKAYLIKDWKILSMVCTAPYIFVFFAYKFIPESIKWLHLHGQMNRVMDTVERVASWNNKKIESKLEIIKPEVVHRNMANPLDLFRPRKTAINTLIQGYLWLVCATCYYGLHMAANDLGGSIYRDFLILNLTEPIAISIAVFVCDKVGRKRATLAPLTIGSIICLTIAALSARDLYKSVRVGLGILGNFCCSISFNAIYPWSVELYPLYIRNEGMGFLQVVSHGGSGAAPWIVKGLKYYGKWCPFVALGLPALIGSLAALHLPETKVKQEKTEQSDLCEEKDPEKAVTNQGFVSEKEECV